MATQYLPDLILMDIHMPKMGGVEATRRIIQSRPKSRILIVSATIKRNMKHIFEALQYGALDYAHSPSLSYAPGTKVSPGQLAAAGAEMLKKLHTILRISESKVVDNVRRSRQADPSWSLSAVQTHAAPPTLSKNAPQMVAIGCSTGGPTTVAMLLSHLIQPFPVPILICQHIDAEFTQGFVSWLTEQTGLAVSVARNRTLPEPGKAYVAPGGNLNLELSTAGRMMLTPPLAGQVYLPNISHLFLSMAENLGSGACGVVLTGMGSDGASGLAAIRQMKGQGFAQDLQSAVVDSMPRAALKALNSEIGYPPQQLARKLNECFTGEG